MPAIAAGVRLTVKHHSELTPEATNELRRIGITRASTIYVTFVDSDGISFYAMGGGLRSDLAAFVLNGLMNWRSYFDVGSLFDGLGANAGHIGSKHAPKRFPNDC